MSALDAFSSPHGADPLDGVTVRAMAQTVLSLATGRPLPDQGRGIRRSYLIFDVVLGVLTVALIISLLRIPGRYRRSRNRGILNQKDLVWRIGLIALLHFVWPLFILYLAIQVLTWKVLVMFQPDFAYWIQAVALIVFLKGVLETVLACVSQLSDN